jgi:hypothetical protein
LATLAAGPIFLVSTGITALYLQLPRPVGVDPALAAPLLLLFVPAVMIGLVLSIIPNLVGSRLLLFIGRVFPAARGYPVWIGTGALYGTALAFETGVFAAPAVAVGLIVTSACCAGLCRLSAFWD